MSSRTCLSTGNQQSGEEVEATC